MLLVRIVTRLIGVVLRVDRALGLQTFQRATPVVAGKDDFAAGIRRPANRVSTDDRRPVNGLEPKLLLRLALPKPLHFQMHCRILGSLRDIDRNDGARGSLIKTDLEGVLVGRHTEVSSYILIDITGQIVLRRLDAIAYQDRFHGGQPRLFENTAIGK